MPACSQARQRAILPVGEGGENRANGGERTPAVTAPATPRRAANGLTLRVTLDTLRRTGTKSTARSG